MLLHRGRADAPQMCPRPHGRGARPGGVIAVKRCGCARTLAVAQGAAPAQRDVSNDNPVLLGNSAVTGGFGKTVAIARSGPASGRPVLEGRASAGAPVGGCRRLQRSQGREGRATSPGGHWAKHPCPGGVDNFCGRGAGAARRGGVGHERSVLVAHAEKCARRAPLNAMPGFSLPLRAPDPPPARADCAGAGRMGGDPARVAGAKIRQPANAPRGSSRRRRARAPRSARADASPAPATPARGHG